MKKNRKNRKGRGGKCETRRANLQIIGIDEGEESQDNVIDQTFNRKLS